MRIKLPLYSILIFMFFLEIIVASPVNAIIKIMPLGNSILQGISSGVSDPAYQVSYRWILWNLLVTNGYDVDFVGTLNNGSAVFGNPELDDHEGHPGWTADEIVNGASYDPGAGKLEDWLIYAQPDIVLLHIGTNDLFWDQQDPAEVAIEVSQILDKIDAYSVDIPVILALIVNNKDYLCGTGSSTTTFNNDVYNMAMDRINNPLNPAYPDKIEIVDMECRPVLQRQFFNLFQYHSHRQYCR